MAEDSFAGRVADRYDETSAEMFAPEVVDPAVELLAGLAEDGPALELGIGTGRIALPLVRRGVEVHGIDLSLDMIALVEGAERQKTPNEIALNILLAVLTLVFLLVVVTLQPFAAYAQTNISIPVLVSLLVCLIPTTIGALISAIGIAGMLLIGIGITVGR